MTYHAISLWGILASVSTLAISAAVSRRFQLGVEKDLFVGGIRAFAQLMLVGYILDWILADLHAGMTLAVLIWMSLWAAWDAQRRQKRRVPGMFRVLLAAIAFAVAVDLAVAILFVVRPEPVWHPRFVIPIAGMLTASAMNAASQGLHRLGTGLAERAQEVEMRLALSETPLGAAGPIIREAVQNSLIPAINSLMVAGIIHLPGMMAGQIIAGAAAVEAVKYQLLILYTFGATSVLAAVLATRLGVGLYFTHADQLRPEALPPRG